MTITWTRGAAALLVPFPGQPWTIDPASLKKAERAIASECGQLPESLTVAEEVSRGLGLRLNHRYGETGNHPRDSFGRDLVDVWTSREGVDFATQVLIAVTRVPPRNVSVDRARPYEVRRDGQPWRRLREHLAIAAVEAVDRAKAVAASAWNDLSRDPEATPLGISSLRAGLAYAFCDDVWTAEVLPSVVAYGYGQLAVLAAVRDPGVLTRTIEQLKAKQSGPLVEELPPHAPNIMRTLGEDGADLIIGLAQRAKTKPIRKLWVDLVSCYSTADARQYVAAQG